MEERIGYIAAAHFSEEIQGKEQLFLDTGWMTNVDLDTTRYKASQMSEMQKQVSERELI